MATGSAGSKPQIQGHRQVRVMFTGRGSPSPLFFFPPNLRVQFLLLHDRQVGNSLGNTGASMYPYLQLYTQNTQTVLSFVGFVGQQAFPWDVNKLETLSFPFSCNAGLSPLYSDNPNAVEITLHLIIFQTNYLLLDLVFIDFFIDVLSPCSTFQ